MFRVQVKEAKVDENNLYSTSPCFGSNLKLYIVRVNFVLYLCENKFGYIGVWVLR